MTATVTLFTDRPGFEPLWRPALERTDLFVRTRAPDTLPTSIDRNVPLIVDAVSEAYDEDEVLTAVGFARALGAMPIVHLPEDGSMDAVDDLLDEMCSGMVARGEGDIRRLASSIARRVDRGRTQRFEFVTVSPRDSELLVVLGDGRTFSLPRPLSDTDDGSEVQSIDIAEDAASATLQLTGGHAVELRASAVAQPEHDLNLNGGNGLPIDGTRLGARLRELRLAAGLTQAELARRTGIHRPNIARVEAGRHTPSLDTLARLASAIGVSTTRVLTEE